jgi:RND family efflux transporter MFP subunit
MQKKFKIFLSFLTMSLLTFGLAGCGSEAAANMNGVSVKTAAAEKHKLQTNVDVAGVLLPVQTVNIASKISGQVTSMGFDVGSSVKVGETLITLETKTLNAQLQQAQSSLQAAEAAVQSAQNQAEQAKINLDTAQKAYDRTKALFDANSVSQSQLEDATSKLQLTQKQYDIASGPAQNQAQAAINTAQANINSINVQLENATITSPINGIITNRNLNPGEVASVGVSLLTIADTSTLKLKGTISQEAVPLLKSGDEVNISIDIYPNKVFKGQISSIGPVAVSTGKYFPIEISISNTGDIKAGLSAHAPISLTTDENIIIPAAAVVQNNGQSYVYVIKDNVASKRTVETGLANDKEIEIIKGLDSGEKVATTNLNSLSDKMPVHAN